VGICSGGSVSILLGNGDGTFQAPLSFNTIFNSGFQTSAFALAAGDFNGDGKVDLAVSTFFQGGAIIIYQGQGDGTFLAGAQYTIGTTLSQPPQAIVVADFNGDGKLDLALADGIEASHLSILLGNGDGTFQSEVEYATGSYPYAIMAADFNGDGKLDLAVANANVAASSVSILFGNGDGTFQTHVDYPTGVGAQSLALGDFNGDGKLDLIAADTASNTLSVLFGNGDGTFQPHQDFVVGARPISIVARDFNGDGHLDLAVANNGSNTVSILLRQIPIVALSGSTLAFGNQPIGTSSGAQAVTLKNSGTAILGISSVALTGPNGGDFSQTNNCGNSVAVGVSCTINVTFTPTTTGAESAILSVNDNAAGSPQTLTLTGTGMAPLVITASSGTMTYGSAPPSITPSYSGFVNGDTAASLSTPPTCSTAATSHSPAGSYPSTCAGAVESNYAISYVSGTVTDSAAPLLITAGSASMTYGGTVPTITPSYSGFVNGDAAGSFTTPPTCSTTATSHSPAGSYPSTCAGAVDSNYTFSYATGTVADSAAPLVVTAGSASMPYGGTPPTITPGYSGFVNGDTSASLTTPPACSTTASTSTPVGTDAGADTCSGAVDPNYSFTYVAGNMTVNQATPVITWTTPATITYGANLSSTQLDATASVPGTFAYSPAAGTTPAVGTDTLSVTFTPTNTTDYMTATQTVSLTVSKATPVITWATPASITEGTTLSSTQLNATASVPGAFVYSPAAGTTPAAGMDNLSVTFTPTDTTDYNTATATVTLAVADFTFTAPSGSSTSATAAPGQPATYTLSVGGQGGMSGTVTFTCTGAPSEATCTVSPNPVTAGSTATNVTVSVTTTAASLSAPHSRPLPPAPPLMPGLRGLLMLALLLAAIAWPIMRRNLPGLSRWQSTMLPLAAGLLLTLALSGCGGGGGGGGGTTYNPGTPAGTYTLTVTGTAGSGSSALSHSMTLTLTVS
jgi:hypothetical protein